VKIPKDALGSNIFCLVNKDCQSTESRLVACNRRFMIDYVCNVFISFPEKHVVQRTCTCGSPFSKLFELQDKHLTYILLLT
jgi:hypothetical protein